MTAPITIVSGCPGCGKTTLSARLAAARPNGLHLQSDTFYTFPAHPIDPTDPRSQAQNTAIMQALGAASGAFARAGYDVYLEGVIGPWFLPTLVDALPPEAPLAYVVLRAPLDLALARVRERQGEGVSATVEHMHRAFAELGPYAEHALDASHDGPEAIAERYEALAAEGRFALTREDVAARA